MSGMVLDACISIIKAKIARRDRSEASFPHALRQLTDSEYQSILARSNTSKSMSDYMRINGQSYAIGENAKKKSYFIIVTLGKKKIQTGHAQNI